LLVQSTQAAPDGPHAFGALPAAQVVLLLQHEPLHACAAEHEVTQACVVVSQESPPAQSLEPLQPHVPPAPPAALTHEAPTLEPPQGVHASPLEPHAAGELPLVQTPAAQQPPWQSWDAEHAVVHVCVVASHALPSVQSEGPLHPHVPPLPASLRRTHALPTDASPARQLAHTPPAAPQAAEVSLATHVAPSQHVPLHG
jgi:hypothetical protein